MELNELLMFMTKKGASDLHIKPMRPPLLRIQGRLIPIKANPLQPEEVEKMLGDIMKWYFDNRFSLNHLFSFFESSQKA